MSKMQTWRSLREGQQEWNPGLADRICLSLDVKLRNSDYLLKASITPMYLAWSAYPSRNPKIKENEEMSWSKV
jgi:hypothetical protein